MAITPLPPAPTRDDPANFSAKGDALMTQLPTFVTEANVLAASMNSIAAGTAFNLSYTFDSVTTDADPTAGKLRLGSITQNTSTVIRINLTGADGILNTTTLNDFVSSTNAVKGQIRLVKVGDASKWIAFNITAIASPTGYKNITVTPVSWSTANPFVLGDSLAILFTRAGDLGVALPYAWFRDEKTTNTSGGTLGGGESQRTLNTTKVNTTGISLASDVMTIPAGTYQVKARCPAYGTLVHRAQLYNVSDSTTIIMGSNATTTSTNMSDSCINGQFTLAASKQVSLRHYGQSSLANGGGLATTNSGGEIYSEIELWKVA